MDPASLKAELTGRASSLGFAKLGVARAERLGVEAERLRAWLDADHHGGMGWMEETFDVRVDPGHPGMLPEVRSIVVLVHPYVSTADDRRGPAPARVARYARGRDYHNVIGKRLRKLTAFLRESGHHARASIDSMPVFERAWAQRAGVGFIGKNCCLIVPGLGSHVFLACLLTTAELPVDSPMRERCGSCSLCLEACPTEAFLGPRAMDARRCISYLTIEHRGEVHETLRPALGDWLFGCDVCQDVCPYNRIPKPSESAAAFAPSPRLENEAATLLTMDEEEFRRWSEGSPMRRPGREGLARNAAYVLGNVGDKRHLPVLAHAAAHDASPVVRDASRWALDRLASRERDQDAG